MGCENCDHGCPMQLEDRQPCGKAPEVCAGHYAALEAVVFLVADFVGRVCGHYEGDPLPPEREAKVLDAMLATAMRRRPTSATDKK